MLIDGKWERLFWALAYEAPFLFCCLAGLLLAVYYRRIAPRPCLLVALGCLLILPNGVARDFLNAGMYDELGLSNVMQTSDWIVDVLYIMMTSFEGIGLLLVVAAALVGRTRPALPGPRSHETTEPLLSERTEVLPPGQASWGPRRS
jgi:hypothetical protein